jgi:hypothetical protein
MQCRFVVLSLAVLASLNVLSSAQGQIIPPSDAQTTCTLTQDQINTWFATGQAALNGTVVPANGVAFAPASACDFYKWSWQMFLWANSRQPPGAGGTLVFNSPIFFDASALGLNGQRTFVPNVANQIKSFSLFRSQVNAKGQLAVTDNVGNTVNLEEGQAQTGGVLMSQNLSLVYYGMHVNDVFAYFLTGNKNGGIMPAQTTFPVSQQQLDLVKAFAATKGNTLPDANALVVELKTSWIDASTVDASKFITMTAEVPTYDRTLPNKWVPNGAEQKTLAMVGMHVVGTVNNHPEMVWATFEHMDNAPNGSFSYINAMNNSTSVPQTTAGTWLFCSTNSIGPFNNKRMASLGGDNSINATLGNSIGPSDTIRTNAWGSGTVDANAVQNNTQIISLNNSVLNLIPNGDVRKNYLLIGAVWTSGAIPGVGTASVPSIGSQSLSNATMETYARSKNCFGCHNGVSGGSLGTPGAGGLSHIYGDLQPLQ